MLDRVVWRPIGKSRAVGLYMPLAKLHLFVIQPADYAAKLLLRMGKEYPKHVELPNF
jgi:hypothetical protein